MYTSVESLRPTFESVVHRSAVIVVMMMVSATSAAFAQLLEKDPAEEEARETIPDVIGEWQVDENGQEFRILKLHKPSRVEGRDYIRVDEDSLRGAIGLPIDFFKEDEEYFWVREIRPKEFISRTPAEQPSPFPPAPPAPGPAQWTTQFDIRSRGLPTSGQWRNGFQFVDMNGDGRLDLVHGPARKGDGRPNVYLQGEDGSWQKWQLTIPPLELDYGDIEAGDFDKDGKMDLALGMHLRGGLVLLGDGKGTFRFGGSGISYRANMNDRTWTGRALTSADLDDDGDLDLVFLGEGMEPPGLRQQQTRELSGASGSMLYRNEGLDEEGQLQWTPVPVNSEAFGDSIEVGDIDADGIPEFAHSNQVHRGGSLLWKFDPESKSYQREAVDVLSLTMSVAFANVDGEPGDELISAGLLRTDQGWSQAIRWHKKDAEGVWSSRSIYDSPHRSSIFAMATGDLDGDDVVDLVATTDDAEILMFKGVGGGEFERIENTLTERTPTCGARSVELEDLDGDGRDELAVSFSGESTVVPGVGDFPGCTNDGSIRIWSPGKFSRLEEAASD